MSSIFGILGNPFTCSMIAPTLFFLLIQVSLTVQQFKCGLEDTNPSREICCGGKVHPLYQNSKKMACCTRSGMGELYPKREKLCCGEQLIPVPQHGTRLICCNKEIIDSKIYGCCGDGSYGEKYLRKDNNRVCCTESKIKKFGIYTIKNDYSCCGSLYRQKEKEECVRINDTYIVRNVSKMIQCGKKMYDPAVSICCDRTGKVLPKPANHVSDIVKRPKWVCWNDELVNSNIYNFDYKTSIVYPKGSSICGRKVYNPENKLKCCGDTLFQVSAENHKNITCCNGKPFDLGDTSKQCCNNEVILSANKGCCNGSIFEKGRDVQCCAKTLINKSSEICCETHSSYLTVVKKQHTSHTNCCRSSEMGRIQTFNKYKQVCQRGEVKDSKQGETAVDEETKETRTPKCPFCTQKVDQALCSKTNVLRFFVYDMRKTTNGTILNSVILKPDKLRTGEAANGEKIRVRTKTHCPCFRIRKNYYLLTNRKLKSFKEDRYNIRFTANDVFIAESDISRLTECLTFNGVFI